MKCEMVKVSTGYLTNLVTCNTLRQNISLSNLLIIDHISSYVTTLDSHLIFMSDTRWHDNMLELNRLLGCSISIRIILLFSHLKSSPHEKYRIKEKIINE